MSLRNSISKMLISDKSTATIRVTKLQKCSYNNGREMWIFETKERFVTAQLCMHRDRNSSQFSSFISRLSGYLSRICKFSSNSYKKF